MEIISHGSDLRLWIRGMDLGKSGKSRLTDLSHSALLERLQRHPGMPAATAVSDAYQ